MSKRFVTTLLIVLAAIIFIVAVYFLILFLAPGLSLLGLRYIAKDARVAAEKGSLIEYIVNKDDSDEYNSTDDIFYNVKGIKIITSEIPVNIITQGWDYEFDYYDNYNGFTTSKIKYPSISIDYKDGFIIISTEEFGKFIGEMYASERYLNVYIPSLVIGTNIGNKIDLEIESKKSNIKFGKDGEDTSSAYFSNLKITTTGKFTTNSKLIADTFDYTTNQRIDIKDGENVVDATNYILESRNGSININKAVRGYVTVKTNYGDIRLSDVGTTLTATTAHGNIYSSSKERFNVNGLVIISSKSGNVTIGKILGKNGHSIINTHSGNVNISSLENIEVETTRGSVDIKTLNKAKIITNLGKVTVEEVKESIDVNTKRGNIYLGEEEMVVNNVTAFSRLGKVFVYSATGTTNLETVSGNIEFTNGDSDDITISCGGKLKATGLEGKVKIYSNKDASLEFSDVSGDVTIDLSDKCYNASIICSNNTTDSVRYSLTGAHVEVYISNETGGYTRASEGEEQNNQSNASAPIIKLTSKYAQVKIYFQSSEIA